MIGLTFAGMIIVYAMLRCMRIAGFRPVLLPGKFLKRAWENWHPASPGKYSKPSHLPLAQQDVDTSYHSAAASSSTAGPQSNMPRREASVRSVITLPAYSPVPKPEEMVLGRAGERAGMDIVVEFPETAEEEEARREEEMESLYRIRERRRQELAQLEEYRRQRREALARGDRELVRILDQRREAGRLSDPEGMTAAELLAEHRSRPRGRRVSEVTYADVGLVRHDGSRVRTPSAESDRQPLLDDLGRRSTSSLHSRVHSGTSTFSAASSTFSLNSGLRHTSQSDVRLDQDDGDLAALRIPPPDYEALDWGETPPYESPTENQRQQSSNLPVIRIDPASSTATPVVGSPTTPRPHDEAPSTDRLSQ